MNPPKLNHAGQGVKWFRKGDNDTLDPLTAIIEYCDKYSLVIEGTPLHHMSSKGRSWYLVLFRSSGHCAECGELTPVDDYLCQNCREDSK